MTQPEFSASGVRISRWPRSLTRAGAVVVRDGRLALLTSRGREIDSAPLSDVQASTPRWYGPRGRARVALDGRRYALRLDGNAAWDEVNAGTDAGARLLGVLAGAREHATRGVPGTGRG
ncbi:hypothetical protein ABZ832_29375 [Streptantibioticus parmotrematis]|uniref:hypothetical protein n=1 Tax=Streptantibioticus parmotrematis TaxID=2873249 RepID=UPI0033F3EBEE